MSSRKSLLGIIGTSGSSKTTLVEQLIARFVYDEHRVASTKYAHHGLDLDSPDKDSHRMREAGNAGIVLAGGKRLVLMCEYADTLEPELNGVLVLLSPVTDLVTAKDYEHSIFPRVEVFHPSPGRPPLWPAIGDVMAVAIDLPDAVQPPEGVAVLSLNDVDAVYRFAVQQLAESVI